MKKQSFWKEITEEASLFPSLTENIETEIAIIGAGITGVTAALELKKAGHRVVVLEAATVAGGTTGYSTGNLYVPVQPYFQSIVNKFDEETAGIVARARRDAIDFIEKTVNDNQIDCQFHRRPFYFYVKEEKNVSKLEKEVAALQKAGIDIDYTYDLPLPEKYIKAAKIDRQARFNPYQYVRALAKKLHTDGCEIYEMTRVTKIEEKDQCIISTTGGQVKADKVIMATHIPKGFNVVQTLVAPYRSYVVAVELEGDYPDGNFWDLDKQPAHAISSHSTHEQLDMLMFAGNHHKTGQSEASHEKNYKEIEAYIRNLYPVKSIAFRWSAQHYAPADGLPYIGPSARTTKKIYMATGYSADGLTYGTVAGMLLASQIEGKENTWNKAFNSTRFTPLKSAEKFIKETVNVASEMVKDYRKSYDEKAFADIRLGEARVMEIDGKKLAVTRDDKSVLHVVSAVCPHLGCIVHYNDAEKTWDCPCHGSRFELDGSFIEGPAYEPLPPIVAHVSMAKDKEDR